MFGHPSFAIRRVLAANARHDAVVGIITFGEAVADRLAVDAGAEQHEEFVVARARAEGREQIYFVVAQETKMKPAI